MNSEIEILIETNPETYACIKDILKDLEKLNNIEINFIIRSFYNEKENFKKTENFDLESLINVFNKTKEVFKKIKPLIHSMNFPNTFHFLQKKIKYLFYLMDKIKLIIKTFKNIRILKEKLMGNRIFKNSYNSLVDECLLYIHEFYYFLNNFIFLHKFYLMNDLKTSEILFKEYDTFFKIHS